MITLYKSGVQDIFCSQSNQEEQKRRIANKALRSTGHTEPKGKDVHQTAELPA